MKKIILILAFLTAQNLAQSWWITMDDAVNNNIDTSSLTGQLFVIASENWIEVDVPEQTDYTVSVWVRIATAGLSLSNLVGGSTAKGLRFYTAGNFSGHTTTSAVYNGSVWLDADVELADYKWHYCTVSYESATDSVKLYVDGVFKSKTQTTDGGYQGAAILSIGSGDAGIGFRYFGGDMANVAVWDRALTASEIQAIMNKKFEGLSASQLSGLLAWWALDDRSGATIPDKLGNYDGTWH